MLSLTLGRLIHEERQREIARRLELRRLREPPTPVEPAPACRPQVGGRPSALGAAS